MWQHDGSGPWNEDTCTSCACSSPSTVLVCPALVLTRPLLCEKVCMFLCLCQSVLYWPYAPRPPLVSLVFWFNLPLVCFNFALLWFTLLTFGFDPHLTFTCEFDFLNKLLNSLCIWCLHLDPKPLFLVFSSPFVTHPRSSFDKLKN